ncbi:S1/P1 nuclease [Rhodoferax sp. WC2427]|uniref:S1/P1 nuclease n=1 Tax=Rhodoferax sp. WC2427 TaxID=3234144 RepID=UPI0034665090
MGWLLVLACLAPLRAAAWGHQGHMLVGAIADQLLTPQARAGLQRDMGLTLAQAAPWADCAKGVGLGTRGFEYAADERWPSPACTRFETAEGVQAMQSYASRNWNTCGQLRDCHKTYHYADVAYQHGRYRMGYVGTNDHDLVHAINAAIAQLQGQPVPPPFSITSRGEALRLLAHFIGDLHQPLHVGALYLDEAGNTVDPDAPGGPEPLETRGGNSLDMGHGDNLHALWDDLPDGLRADAVPASMVQAARALRKSRAAAGRLAQTWASDTVAVSGAAFAGVTVGPSRLDRGRVWPATLAEPADYRARQDALQTRQLTKAGARLAQLVNVLYATPR